MDLKRLLDALEGSDLERGLKHLDPDLFTEVSLVRAGVAPRQHAAACFELIEVLRRLGDEDALRLMANDTRVSVRVRVEDALSERSVFHFEPKALPYIDDSLVMRELTDELRGVSKRRSFSSCGVEEALARLAVLHEGYRGDAYFYYLSLAYEVSKQRSGEEALHQLARFVVEVLNGSVPGFSAHNFMSRPRLREIVAGLGPQLVDVLSERGSELNALQVLCLCSADVIDAVDHLVLSEEGAAMLRSQGMQRSSVLRALAVRGLIDDEVADYWLKKWPERLLEAAVAGTNDDLVSRASAAALARRRNGVVQSFEHSLASERLDAKTVEALWTTASEASKVRALTLAQGDRLVALQELVVRTLFVPGLVMAAGRGACAPESLLAGVRAIPGVINESFSTGSGYNPWQRFLAGEMARVCGDDDERWKMLVNVLPAFHGSVDDLERAIKVLTRSR